MQEQTAKKRGPRAKKTEQQEANMEKNNGEVMEQEKKPENTFTMEQVQKMIEEALAKRDATNKEPSASNAMDGVVTMRFQAEVNDNNVIPLGPNGKFGQITGKSATITIAKRDFIGEFRTVTVQNLLKNRNLIVLDGLTDEERKLYGLEYQKGEYLEPVVYERLLEMGDGVLDVFPKLNPTWREMVATKFAEAYENKTLKVSRETLIALNRISKKDYSSLPKEDERRKGGFYGIIHQMNAADEAEE